MGVDVKLIKTGTEADFSPPAAGHLRLDSLYTRWHGQRSLARGWIGGYRYRDGFKWSDNSQFNVEYWMRGEPNNFNGDEMARYAWGIYGLPQKLLHDKDVIEKRRAERAELNQKMQKQQQEQHMADQVQKMAPAVLQAQAQQGGSNG